VLAAPAPPSTAPTDPPPTADAVAAVAADTAAKGDQVRALKVRQCMVTPR